MMIVIPIQSVTLFRFRNSQSSEDMGHMAHRICKVLLGFLSVGRIWLHLFFFSERKLLCYNLLLLAVADLQLADESK
jgi:hypothetical protein